MCELGDGTTAPLQSLAARLFITSHRMKLSLLLLSIVAATFAQATVAQEKKDVAAAPVSMCIGCHSIPGYQASFPQVYRVPKIGGQTQQYLEAALKAYRQGARNHPSMTGVAKGLSDQEISALAAYYAARGNPVVSAAAK